MLSTKTFHILNELEISLNELETLKKYSNVMKN